MFTVQQTTCVALCLLMLWSCSPLNNNHQSIESIPTTLNAQQTNTPEMYLNEIPIRAAREVMQRFGSLENVTWQKISSGGWLARCKTSTANNRISFDASGVWNEILISYSQTPAFIQAMVKRNFAGYCVTSISAIGFPWDTKNMLISVTVVKAGNCKVLKVYKGEMTVFSDFTNIGMPAGK